MGISIRCNGKPISLACWCSNSTRTACMATRPNAAFTVVNNPVTSCSPDWRKTCSAHAATFPLLQLSQVFAHDKSSNH